MLLASCFTLKARAQTPPTAAHEISLWYRSAVGCPDGDAFVQVLAQRQVSARLARVGDSIDFVVTLGVDHAGRSSGVLERQATTGAVAIRKVEDASCEQVAEAIALSLALSINEPAAVAQPVAVAATSVAPVPTTPAPALAPVVTAAPPPPTAAAVRNGTHVWLGVQAGVIGGTVVGVAPTAALFAELEIDRAALLRPALRLALLGAIGSDELGNDKLDMRLLAARIQGCPVRLGGDVLHARPCLAFDLGQLRTEATSSSGRVDAGLFAAASASGRLVWRALDWLGLEAELGLTLPLTRYTLAGLYRPRRAAALGLVAGLGVALQIP